MVLLKMGRLVARRLRFISKSSFTTAWEQIAHSGLTLSLPFSLLLLHLHLPPA